MPGCDVDKGNYPPCNRAFALRMMNPTSYADEHTSPLDKQIQPYHKKFTANSATPVASPNQVRRSDYVSVDEISLSPASSVTSLSEMELYDIDENNYAKHTTKSSSSSNEEREQGMIRRSYSSVDGFSGYFDRQSVNRLSMPTRRSKNTARNAYQGDLSPQHGNRVGSSLRRTQSLKGGNRPNVSSNSSSPGRVKSTSGAAQKSPTTKIRVVATKSSQLRAKVTETKQKQKQKNGVEEQIRFTKHPPTAQKKMRTSSTSGKSKSLNCTEEYIESDSSNSIFSELDAYNPRFNPRGKSMKMNGHHHSPVRQNRRVPSNKESPLQYSPPSAPSPKLNINNQYSSRPGAQNADTFSNKLSEVCRLISERHPGDFQILETLTEMQTAYEERDELVKNTISNLRDRARTLEHKCANSPNIPGLVIPLMRATNAFQTQLQGIMDAYHVPGKDRSMQFPESVSKLDEIAAEANLVANQIEKMTLCSHRVSLHSPRQNQDNFKHGGETVFEGSFNSDKENVCNGEHRENSTLGSYQIIGESPAVTV